MTPDATHSSLEFNYEIQQEIEIGNIKAEQFTLEAKEIKFHGHCHQKALSNQSSSFAVLNLPKNYKVIIIPSGCCGMAGSFGYEKEHYKTKKGKRGEGKKKIENLRQEKSSEYHTYLPT